jgi:uncharacterized protein YggE
MKPSIAFSIFFWCCPFVMMAQTEKNFIDQNYIEITGTAETLVIPDEIYIAVTLTEKNHKKTIEAQEQLLLANLKSLGIDLDTEVSIVDFEGNYQRRFLGKNEVEKKKKFQVLVHDGTTLSKTFMVLDRLNITNAFIQKVSHSEIEKFRRETKLKSLIVAKEKAQQYAQAIDQEIGRALFIQEKNYNAYEQAQLRSLNTSNVVLRQEFKNLENVDFQKISLTATVLTRFELKTKNE